MSSPLGVVAQAQARRAEERAEGLAASWRIALRERIPPLSGSPFGLVRWYAPAEIVAALEAGAVACSFCGRPIAAKGEPFLIMLPKGFSCLPESRAVVHYACHFQASSREEDWG